MELKPAALLMPLGCQDLSGRISGAVSLQVAVLCCLLDLEISWVGSAVLMKPAVLLKPLGSKDLLGKISGVVEGSCHFCLLDPKIS